MSVKAVAHLKRPSEKQRTLVVSQVPFPPLGTQLNLLFPDGRQTSVILKPGQSLEAKLREVEVRFKFCTEIVNQVIQRPNSDCMD
jgi:hypothetical protein